MGHFHVGMACLNGHAVNDSADSSPEFSSPFCKQCGEATITQCPKCNQHIHGSYYAPSVIVLGSHWKPPKFCHACGKPYPWTELAAEAISEAIGELDGLSTDDAEKLRASINDVLNETPKTDLAVGRFKKAIAKGGKFGGKMLYDTIIKFGAEVAVKSIMGG